MAAPTIFSSAYSSETSNSVTSNITLPASIAAGDLIIAILGSDVGGGTNTWPSPWVVLQNNTGSNYWSSVAYLISPAGGETTVAVTHTTEQSNHIAVRIKAAEWHGTTPPEWGVTSYSSTTTTLDPPSLTASWGSAENLWIAALFCDDSATPFPVTAWPYASNQLSNVTSTSSCAVALCSGAVTTATENPGAFTITNAETGRAFTIVVRPSAAPAPQNINVTQPSETDLSQAVARSKALAFTQPSETDLSQAVAVSKALALTQASETDLAQPITLLQAKLIAVGQATETDLTQPIASLKVGTKWATYTNDCSTNTDFTLVQPTDGSTGSDGNVMLISFNGTTDDVGSATVTAPHDLTGSQVVVSVSSPVQDAFGEAQIRLIGQNPADYIEIRVPYINDDSFYYASTSAAYSASEDTVDGAVYTKMTEASGTVHFWFSDNGMSWTEIGTGTTSPWWLPESYLQLRFETTDAIGNFVEFDQINLVTFYVASGQATETDQAQPITAWKTVTVGQPAETDLAQALTHSKSKALTQPIETDAAQPIAVPGAIPVAVGQATETDLGQAVTGSKALAVTQPSETDLAQALTQSKSLALTQPSETDLAQPITGLGVILVAVGQAQEGDTCGSSGYGGDWGLDWGGGHIGITPLLAPGTLGQSNETDLAQAVTSQKTKALTQPVETDVVLGVTRSKAKVIGQATETDVAQAVTFSWVASVTQPSETDLAQPITGLKSKAIGEAFETDVAQVMSFLQLKQIAVGQASETDLAQLVVSLKSRTVGQPAETDLAQAITKRKGRVLGQPSETDVAQALSAVFPDRTWIIVDYATGVTAVEFGEGKISGTLEPGIISVGKS